MGRGGICGIGGNGGGGGGGNCWFISAAVMSLRELGCGGVAPDMPAIGLGVIGGACCG
jgi:hypothetical protein